MGASKTRDYDYKNDQVIKEQDSNGSSGYAPIRSQLASYRASRGRDTTYDYRATAQNGIVKNNFVSFSVLAGVSLFFIFLAIAYLGMRTDTSVVPAGFTMASCRSDSKPGVNCVPERDAADAIYLLNAVQVELTRRAVANVCERRDGDGASPTTRSAMTEDEIVDFCLDNFGIKDDIKIRKDLRNLEILTYSNPQWNIRIVQTLTKNVVPTKDDQISNMEQVIFNKDKKVTSLVIFDADLPWMCRMTNIVYFLLNSAVFLVVTFALLYSLNYGYKHYKHQQQKQKEELGLMLERIIEILQTSATEEGENYVVINHIRDMILPVQDRQTKEKTWNKAVQFINENESRVRTEVQNVQGEPYEVWRWIGSATLGLSSSPRNNKSWQGQAFETQAGSVNGLQCSPTPCLKIRGMAEEVEGGGQAGEAQRAIREAVLGKCAHQCRILHCAVDAHSSCVYLKCADQADAAVAYRNLHGWWYAGHLVTVKYLRLERYMQRFPGSPISGPPFMKAISPATDWTS
ncbi:unnamed protein product [Brassicogethes aeneus]|uniref:Man1/Src1-like C-terminal domain-containing protein n=1 Tax=Brassicogethes aeneus TaxID=1431903 RepID=A0A9P0FE65_BRAAE|nr:unnamed protein product [Brassicogethes aeneus]